MSGHNILHFFIFLLFKREKIIHALVLFVSFKLFKCFRKDQQFKIDKIGRVIEEGQ